MYTHKRRFKWYHARNYLINSHMFRASNIWKVFFLFSIFLFFIFFLVFIRNEFVYCGYCFFLICTPRNLYEYICFAFSAFNVLHVIVFVLLLCFIFFIHRHCQLCHAVVAAVSYLTSFPSYYCRHQVVLSTVVLSEIS